jgi:hypothetical protein
MLFTNVWYHVSSNCRGDKAFCSVECREHFMEDETEGEPATAIDHSDPSGPSFDDGRIFQLIQ